MPKGPRGFPKKLDNQMRVLALYFAFYNFVRVHKTLRRDPAVAARESRIGCGR